MNETVSVAKVDMRDRVMISSESRRTRRIGMVALVGAFGLLILVVARNHYAPDWQLTTRLTWLLSLLLAVIDRKSVV